MQQYEVLTDALNKIERRSNIIAFPGPPEVPLPSFSADVQTSMALALLAVNRWFEDGLPEARRVRLRALVGETLACMELAAQGKRE